MGYAADGKGLGRIGLPLGKMTVAEVIFVIKKELLEA